jgi:hypothetical protein
MAQSDGAVIDAAVRFLRTNPEVMAYLTRAAPGCGRSVDAILADTVRRLRDASADDAVSEEEVIA